MKRKNPWVWYTNGNYRIFINLENGTKIRKNNLDYFEATSPESFDLKITNRCYHNCNMCHEKSTCDGKHGEILNQKFFDTCHPYTEIAIGGGNPLEHPDLEKFLIMCRDHKFIPSMTVHQEDFMERKEYLKKLCDEKLLYGLGVSVSIVKPELIHALKEFPNVVVHLIAGLTPIERFLQLKNNNLKILILGYKIFGRGEHLYETIGDTILDNIRDLRRDLKTIIDEGWFKVVSFDNLAIRQLEVKNLMSKKQWDEFYMGDDGTATMYIDLVKNEFAVCSTATERFPIMDNIQDMFAKVKDLSKHNTIKTL